MNKRLSGALLFAAAFQMMVGLAEAASCGNTGEGFEAWKSTFADEAQTNGASQKAISALIGTSYSSGTIAADRSQKSFALSLDAFMAKRGAVAIAAKGKSLKASNAALFASIENAFGVPAGPLIAIWGWRQALALSWATRTRSLQLLPLPMTAADPSTSPSSFTQR